MDPIRNPYAPGAGTQPPELAGRDDICQRARVVAARIRQGRSAKGMLLIGLRGVGKTVLLNRIQNDIESDGSYALRIEASQGKSLPILLAPQIHEILLRLRSREKVKVWAERALGVLASFVTAMRVEFKDVGFRIDFEPEPGQADSGDLEQDMLALLETLGTAAQYAKTSIVIFIDELQYVDEYQLATLISTLHRCAQQKLPITLIGAGLPQLRGRMGHAKSYAERLFEFPEVGTLDKTAAEQALIRPAEREGVTIRKNAVAKIFEQTKGYPYFLQEWGKHTWDLAEKSPINIRNVTAASAHVIAALDESFFRVRFDQLTPEGKRYLRAMAALGAGPHRSGDIATRMQRSVQKVAPLRSTLIKSGMIWSPGHGDTAFTVPLFDMFMQRIMPGDEWEAG